MADPTVVGEAYDAIAGEYDRLMAGDRWIRLILRRHFRRVFCAGQRVMDAGCGTGSDTLYLASLGVRVLAVDTSERMVAVLQKKLAEAGAALAALVDVRVGDVNQVLDQEAAASSKLVAPLDGVISSFAALNTVDLDRFAGAVGRLVRPGGRLILHLLAPGRRAARARPQVAAPTLRRVVIGGHDVAHFTPAASEVFTRFFARDFICRRAHALGFLVRPRFERRLPAPLVDALGAVETLLGAARPFRARGRFFVIDLERRSNT
jgi:SAM-dependent methyltransferase